MVLRSFLFPAMDSLSILTLSYSFSLSTSGERTSLWNFGILFSRDYVRPCEVYVRCSLALSGSCSFGKEVGPNVRRPYAPPLN